MSFLGKTTCIGYLSRFSWLLMLLIVIGCATVGPDYVKPDTPLSATWSSELKGGLIAEEMNHQTLAGWWTTLNDPALSSLMDRAVSGNQDVAMFQVSVQQDASTEKAQSDIVRLLRERRHLSASDDDNFNVMDMKEIANMLAGTTQLLTTLLAAVAAVSLLVGGIGIMNIMLVSVTERTKEIGIRLAIGALEYDVLMQFLVEAVVLSSLGGLVGIALATAGSVVTARLMQVPYIFNPGINLLAFLFSAAIGVIFGFFPARRAARLDPIDALRHE